MAEKLTRRRDKPPGGYDPGRETEERFNIEPLRLRPSAEIGLESSGGSGPGAPSMRIKVGKKSEQFGLPKSSAAPKQNRIAATPKTVEPSSERFGRGGQFDLPAAPGTRGLKSDEPLSGGRISQRFPKPSKVPGKGWEGKENPLEENLLINMDVLRADPEKLQHASDIIGSYPNATNAMREMGSEERVQALHDQAVENLLHLYDMMPPEQQQRGARWYHGANRIANERAAEVGIHPNAAAGSYAALSPQKDWFQNVYLGDQVNRILAEDPRITREMLAKAATMPAYTKDPATIPLLQSLGGVRLSEMDAPSQALALRLFEETNGPIGSNSGERAYRRISPEGEYGDVVLNADGTPTRPAWGSFNEIQKSVQAAQSGGDPNLISPLMGEKHKVRSFYNDIVNPTLAQRFGDITADTHQIAGSLFRPLSGNTTEVAHGLGSSPEKGVRGAPQSSVTGLQGLYPIYADATRNASMQRDVPVIAMQSVPWEAIRSLFPDTFKTSTNMANIDAIWSAHARGEISAQDARRAAVEAAGGFRPPTW